MTTISEYETAERIPPSDIAAERAVLGAMLTWSETISAVSGCMMPADHFRPAHQMVHEAILNLHFRHLPTDPVAVADELQRREHLAKVGGHEYLHTLMSEAVAPPSASYHARRVHDLSARRKLLEGIERAGQLAWSPGAELADVEAVIARLAEPYEHTATATAAARYEPVNWDAAWQQQPEHVEWLVEPFLEAGTFNVLYAKPGTGKSLLALEWALILARDDRTVVYVDNENRVRDVVERLQAMGAHPSELNGRLYFYSFAGLPPLDTPTGGQHLAAIATAAGASLVVLDTTARLVEGGDNDTDTYLGLDRYTGVPLKAEGIAMLRLSHPGKDENKGQAGASAKSTDVDTVWKLTQSAQGRRYRMQREKNRTGHAPDSDVVDVERHYAPLRHVWTVPDSSAEMTVIGQLSGQLDALGVPPSAGRDRCRTALNEAGVAISNAQLADVVKYRKTVPDSFGTVNPAVPPLPDLSASPPPHRGGDGQDSGHPPEDSRDQA